MAGTSRWIAGDGPLTKAKSAAWLWKGPSTFLLSLQHTNALLREFALGSEDAVEAAYLLLAHIPEEIQRILDSDWQVCLLVTNCQGS